MRPEQAIGLSGDIPLDRLCSIRHDLVTRLAAGPLTVDAAGLTSASLPLVQLLYAAHRTAASNGVAFSVTCSDGGALAGALADFGFLAAARGAPRVDDGVWVGLNT